MVVAGKSDLAFKTSMMCFLFVWCSRHGELLHLKVVFLVHWPRWIEGLAAQPCSCYQVINESLRHTGAVSKHSHWLLTTANLPLLQKITSARCRMCGCAPLFMEYNEGDWLDSAVTPNCRPITHPLDPICYIENCSMMQPFLHYLLYHPVLVCGDVWQLPEIVTKTTQMHTPLWKCIFSAVFESLAHSFVHSLLFKGMVIATRSTLYLATLQRCLTLWGASHLWYGLPLLV